MILELTIGAVIVGAILRGRTGEPELLTESEMEAVAAAVCAELEQTPGAMQTPGAIAEAVGSYRYPDLDWPPKMLATAQHKAVWRQIQLWATELVSGAQAVGFSPCEMLTQGVMPPVPPATPIPATPVLPPITGSSTPPIGSGPSVPIGPGGLAQPGSGGALPFPVASVPTPGAGYKIKTGDNLAFVAKSAWNLYTADPGMQVMAQQAINDDDYNREELTYSANVGAPWLGDERISFLPPFQTIYIPESFGP